MWPGKACIDHNKEEDQEEPALEKSCSSPYWCLRVFHSKLGLLKIGEQHETQSGEREAEEKKQAWKELGLEAALNLGC